MLARQFSAPTRPLASPYRRHPTPGLLVALALAALPGAPFAQVGVPLTLAEAERLALTRSPQVAAQRSLADAAREMASPAGSWPDPKLIAGFDNVPADGADSDPLNQRPRIERHGLPLIAGGPQLDLGEGRAAGTSPQVQVEFALLGGIQVLIVQEPIFKRLVIHGVSFQQV